LSLPDPIGTVAWGHLPMGKVFVWAQKKEGVTLPFSQM